MLRRSPLKHCAALFASAAAVLLTACSFGPDTGEPVRSPAAALSAGPAPEPVLSVAEAARTLDHYEKINNAANARQDKALLGTVEGGQLYEQSVADYDQWSTRSRSDQKKYMEPFHYTDRRYFRPAAGTASWFAVTARTSSHAKGRVLMVFDRVEGSYRKVAALYVGDTIPVSEIAVDEHGLATAADPADRVGSLAPDQLATAFTDLFETGGKNMGRHLASTDVTKESVAFYTKRDQGPNGDEATLRYFAARPAHSKLYALRLAGGGVLAVFPTAHTSEFMLKPQYRSSFRITPTDKESIYDNRERSVVINVMQGQALAELTPAGKPRVLAREYRLVDSH